jgi:hypothetical protein
MKITITEKGEDKIVNVNTWSIVKAVFIGSLILNAIIFGLFIFVGILWGILIS